MLIFANKGLEVTLMEVFKPTLFELRWNVYSIEIIIVAEQTDVILVSVVRGNFSDIMLKTEMKKYIL